MQGGELSLGSEVGRGLPREGKILGVEITTWREGLVEGGPCDAGRLDFVISGDGCFQIGFLAVCVHVCGGCLEQWWAGKCQLRGGAALQHVLISPV